MADFIAEFTQSEGKEVGAAAQWSIHTNGYFNRRVEGAEVVIQIPKRDKIECMIQMDFPTTNNEVEYEALVAGLDLAKAANAENVVLHCDS